MRRWGPLLVLLAVTRAWAEPREIVSSLTLEQAVAAALRDNAQLRAGRAQSEAAGERPLQARALPNPMFKYAIMNSIDNASTAANPAEQRFELEQQFPWFGKQALREKIAVQDAATARQEYAAMEREIVMQVKENYSDLYAVQLARTITRSEEAVLQRLAKTAETLYATGQRSQQDVLKAQAETTMLQQRLLELEQQEATLKAKLNQLLNRPADSPVGLAVTAPRDRVADSAQQLLARATRDRPEIKGAQAQIERNQRERELMKKEFWPDYRLGIEYRHVSGDENLVMFTVGVDLPFWQSKYRAGVREAEKMIESSQAAREAALRQTAFDVQDAWFKLQTARRTLQLYQQTLIPQAEARFQASEASYQTGQTDFLDLLESERFLLNARVMTAMAEGSLGLQLARLERAVGAELKTEGTN